MYYVPFQIYITQMFSLFYKNYSITFVLFIFKTFFEPNQCLFGVRNYFTVHDYKTKTHTQYCYFSDYSLWNAGKEYPNLIFYMFQFPWGHLHICWEKTYVYGVYTVRKFIWWRYCIAQWDEIFEHFPLFDEPFYVT